MGEQRDWRVDCGQMATASTGSEQETEMDVLAAHRVIMAACRRGAISPDRAIQAAADAAAGDVTYLGTLAGIRDFAAAAQAVPNLSSMVLDVLAGEVTAHSHQVALQQAHDSLDRGHPGNYSADGFASMFPPRAPLGPDDDEDDTSPPARKRQVSDLQQRAAAGGSLTDQELFVALYGRQAPTGYFED